MTTTTNQALLKIMRDHNLSCEDIAKTLGVAEKTVQNWSAAPEQSNYAKMPESELRVLQYGLMTENTRHHLF